METLSPGDIETCLHVLKSLLQNRIVLSDIDPEIRKNLLMAAGKLSRPERLELMKLSKTHRRIKKKRERLKDREVRKTSGIRLAREADVFIAPPKTETKTSVVHFLHPQRCYVCKTEYFYRHFFYDKMCLSCGDLNYAKRYEVGALSGKVALVTGGRIKIGFQTVLKLLRAGAHVLVTTRFPKDAATRFAEEKDFSEWENRLEIFGLDLRHTPSVEHFAGFLVRTRSHLDILINNACQTVRRPSGFYEHLMERENGPLEALPPSTRKCLLAYESCKQEMLGLKAASQLSLMPYATHELPTDFPEGKKDADLQQVDLRKLNSWRLTLSQVTTSEMLEVHLINAVAPFVLCARLKALMIQSQSPRRHIVNVSAMEGKFARHTKTDKHPHTNMAKAALNMMTLTSAPDFVKDGIFMNAVDTGWITDEDPRDLSVRKEKEHDFQPPLDIVDGAARIVNPVFRNLETPNPVFGKFLKDYFPTEW